MISSFCHPKFYLLFVVLFSCANGPGAAQHQEITFRHLSTVEGLSNFTVLSIAQDRQGFMWFGTMDGLNRFDGKQIKVYRENPEDPYALGSSYIFSLLCTSDSGMWVGTNRGLYYYDYHHDNFHARPLLDSAGNEIQSILVRSLLLDEDWLWVGTNLGLYRYDLKSDCFISFDEHSSRFDKQLGILFALSKSEDGKIWIGGSNGLMYCENDVFTNISLDTINVERRSHFVLSISFDSYGNVWIGTEDQEAGLYIYDPLGKSTRILSKKEGHLPHNKVNCLYRFEDGTVLAGTTWGLAMINEQTLESRHLYYQRQDPGGLSQNSIKYIFRSRNGIVWIGTYSGGVNYYDPKSQRITHITNKYNDANSLNFNIVSAFYKDKDQKLWIGTEYGGVNIYDASQKIFTVLKRQEGKNSLLSDNIKSITEDKYGRIFIATVTGLSIYAPKEGTFFNINTEPGPRGQLFNRAVQGVCPDGRGNIWIGTRGAGSHFQMYDISRDSILHFFSDRTDFPTVERVVVAAMIYDQKRDVVWAGGENGLAGFDVETRQYITDSAFFPAASTLSQVVINDLHIDDNGLLWIASFGHGLFVLDPDTFQLRRIKPGEGISESSFYAITSDNDGNIWASSNAHLVKISPLNELTEPIKNTEKYGIQQGFPPQQYFRAACFKDEDGRLYFGGDDGFISFNPREVENIILYPSVAVTDVLINGAPFLPRPQKTNQQPNLGSQKSISLSYEQSSFVIQFIAPNFINPDNTWYQYQLLDILNDWQDLGNSNTINFAELKAGDYELRLRASSDPENFAEAYTSLNIHVDPPYWATHVAYLIYLGVILSMLYVFFAIARKWERLNQDLRIEHLELEKEKEFSQRRIRFFTDISHELRTPLTLILAPLEHIVQSNFGNAKIKNQLMLMLRHGDRMLQLINQLLDLRKMETGHLQLQAAKGNIARFVQEVSLSFRELAANRNIVFNTEDIPNKVTVWFDRDKFEIILFNLLSNALKFTPEFGKISVSIDEGGVGDTITEDDFLPAPKGLVRIAVQNSGRGIPGDQIEHVFDRFYSSPDKTSIKAYGSGVGLEIVKNLVELHKGKIKVESTYDENGSEGQTRFVLTMKRGNKHLSKNELHEAYKSSEDISNYRKPIPDVNISKQQEIDRAVVKKTHDPAQSTVLVVEDNPEVRALVGNILEERFNVLLAGDGDEGLAMAFKHAPDLIISDIMMPGVDGIELCRKLKSDVNTSHIPVILLTARTAVTFKYEGLETGADDYIVKPFSVEDLRMRVVNLIRQRKMLKEKFGRSALNLPAEIALTSVDEKMMQRTIDFIIEHIGDIELTVERIAREIGMSRTNFYRKIKALTNMSAAEFLRKIKMDHAARLLKTNKVRVSEVASMVGISDTDHFRKCFKAQFGMTPKDYIESQKKPGLTG